MMSKEYLKWHEKSGIKVGDKVRVLRQARPKELGWYMQDVSPCYSINSILKVRENQRERGFVLDDGEFYPYFVLEVVESSEMDDRAYIFDGNKFTPVHEGQVKVYKVVRKIMGRLMSCRACNFCQGIEYKIGEYVSATPENIKENKLLAAFTSYDDALKFTENTGIGLDIIYKALAKGVSNVLPVWHVPKGTVMCREIKLVEEVKKKEKTYMIGDRFADGEGDKWILARCDRAIDNDITVELVGYEGRRKGWRANCAIKVEDSNNITEEEFREICGGNPESFELIEDDRDNRLKEE
jgi:hypothetical protein